MLLGVTALQELREEMVDERKNKKGPPSEERRKPNQPSMEELKKLSGLDYLRYIDAAGGGLI